MAAAEAAGKVLHLKSRPGRIYALGELVCNVPDVSVYRLGEQTGHHHKLYVWVSEGRIWWWRCEEGWAHFMDREHHTMTQMVALLLKQLNGCCMSAQN